MSTISDNLTVLRSRLADACNHCGRAPESVRLLAVSKNFGAESVRAAMTAGQIEFGENYLQEALEKMTALAGSGLIWHFIGPIQSNKTRDIAAHFDWVQSVDRLKIAQRLSEQRPLQLLPLNVCVQVNISGEASKSGCAPQEALELCDAITKMPRLKLRGLMAIPAPGSGTLPFQSLRKLFEKIRRSDIGTAAEFDTLSVGMSDDFPAAIAEGSTMVRIGTTIFGSRKPQ